MTEVTKEQHAISEEIPTSTNLQGKQFSAAEIENAKKLKQKLRNETHLHGGCGYTTKKAALLRAFWNTLWVELEKSGWRKIEGTGDREGSIKFFPPSKDGRTPEKLAKEGRRGKDYYDRIMDVIDRVKLGQTVEEKNAARKFFALRQVVDKKPRGPGRRKRRKRALSTESHSSDEKTKSSRRKQPILDLSWKNGGSSYPKQSSRVGIDFQVADIPEAGSYVEGSQSDLYELVYNPMHSNCDKLHKILENISPNKREQALAALGPITVQTNAEEFASQSAPVISNLKAVDGSDWSEEETKNFHKEIFRLRKDIAAISKATGKNVKTCYAYYLAKFKNSDDYRLLKVVCQQERLEKNFESFDNGADECAICGDGGSLIICDSCDGEYHMECLRPKLNAVPEGHWECDECVDKKLLKARDFVIKRTKLYQVHNKSKSIKREKRSGTSTGTEVEDVVLRPTSPVLDAVYKFSKSIARIFNSAEGTEIPTLNHSVEVASGSADDELQEVDV